LPLGSTHVLGGIIALSVALRLVSAFLQGDSIATLPGVYDQVSYDTLAQQVLAGRGFTFPDNWWPMTQAGMPTAHWSYLYTLYLAAVYSIFGAHPLIARAIQAVLAGVLYPLLMWRLGRRVFGARVGVVTAALAAVYGYFVYYAGALMTETFYILAVIWALDLAIGIGSRRLVMNAPERGVRWRAVGSWVLLGLAIGAAGLLRQVFLLCVPLLVAWLVWAVGRGAGDAAHSARARMQSVRGLLVSAAVVAVMIAPWTVHNYLVFDRFVPLNTNAGYAFFWGNHPIHGANFVPILPAQVYSALIPPELRDLDEAALDAALLRRGAEFVAQDPGRYLLLSLSRIRDYFQFWPSAESTLLSNVVRVSSFGVSLPLIVYGLVHMAVHIHQGPTAQASGVVLLYLFVGFYTLLHLLTWALIRYRLPLDAVLMPFAAVAALGIWDRFVAGRTGASILVDHRQVVRAPRMSNRAPSEGI
jgi:hypothetical protein